MHIASPVRFALALSLFATICGCVSASALPSAPKPAPTPTPARAKPPAPPPPTPQPAPPSENWENWPIAAGDWSYRAIPGGSIASFGQPGAQPLIAFRCQKGARQILVERLTPLMQAQITGQMTVRTSFGDSQWPVRPSMVVGSGSAYAVATRTATDPVFDRIAFSRGRIAIEAPGAFPLAVPNWPEIIRVVEDCRG